jgi:nucleoid-associated protein YgaU
MPSIKSLASGKNPFEGGLEKMKITGYGKPDFSDEISTYTVQFNPNSFKTELHIDYVGDDQQPQGTTNGEKKLKKVPSQKITINLTLDGTGVSGQNGSTGKSGKFGLTADEFDIQKEIDKFLAATYNYKGTKHDVPFVKIVWGPNKFEGRLRDLVITHVLFKSDGKPLRTKIDATFESSEAAKSQSIKNDLQSPDLTHVRTVKVGDTLPLMCQNIYNDSSYYLKVAQFNNLVDFRNLEPGSEIIFPPVI